jgi:hypothetical protein
MSGLPTPPTPPPEPPPPPLPGLPPALVEQPTAKANRKIGEAPTNWAARHFENNKDLAMVPPLRRRRRKPFRATIATLVNVPYECN